MPAAHHHPIALLFAALTSRKIGRRARQRGSYRFLFFAPKCCRWCYRRALELRLPPTPIGLLNASWLVRIGLGMLTRTWIGSPSTVLWGHRRGHRVVRASVSSDSCHGRHPGDSNRVLRGRHARRRRPLAAIPGYHLPAAPQPAPGRAGLSRHRGARHVRPGPGDGGGRGSQPRRRRGGALHVRCRVRPEPVRYANGNGSCARPPRSRVVDHHQVTSRNASSSSPAARQPSRRDDVPIDVDATNNLSHAATRAEGVRDRSIACRRGAPDRHRTQLIPDLWSLIQLLAAVVDAHDVAEDRSGDLSSAVEFSRKRCSGEITRGPGTKPRSAISSSQRARDLGSVTLTAGGFDARYTLARFEFPAARSSSSSTSSASCSLVSSARAVFFVGAT